MKTKIFTIIKTWYTSGIYWNTGEYFTCIYTKIYNKTLKMDRFIFQGTYWAEERIRDVMEQKNYIYSYAGANYWKLTKKDIIKNTMGEYEAIAYVKNNFNTNIK